MNQLTVIFALIATLNLLFQPACRASAASSDFNQLKSVRIENFSGNEQVQSESQTGEDDPAVAGNLLAERIGFEDPPVSGLDQLDLLSKTAVLKEIELLRLNTRYRIESTRIGKWKPWRQLAYSLAANTLVEVGISHIAYARWKYWRRPGLASKAFLRKGPQCLLIGHAIIVGGVLIETGFDLLAQHQQNKKGFDRKTCRNRVIALKGEIEEVLSSREALIKSASISPDQSRILQVEGKVLSDIKDCALAEFSRLAVREHKIKAARDSANIMNFSQAATGGFIGSLGNLLAVANRKPRLANPAGIGFVVSGAFIVLTPPVSKLFSVIAANREKKLESGLLAFNPQASADLESDRLELLKSSSDATKSLPGLRTRLAIYDLQKDLMEKQQQSAAAEAKLNKREFIEKCVTNAIAGGTKISWGANLIVAGSDYSNTAPKAPPTLAVRLGNQTFRVPVRATKTPAQMFGRRVAQGATSNIAGPFVGALDAIQSRFRGELRVRKAKREGNSPGQILAARLKTLEEMETKLK